MSKSYNYQPAGELTLSTTGNITDLDVTGCGLVRMTNASLTTIQGIKEGYEGQIVDFVSDGAGQIDLAHQSGSETTVSRQLFNIVTSGPTSLAPGTGRARAQYSRDKGRWVLTHHVQGAMIDYTVSSTVIGWSAFVAEHIAYYLTGSLLLIQWQLSGTSNNVLSNFTIPYNMVTTLGAVDFPLGFARDNSSTITSGALLEIAVANPNKVTLWWDAAQSNWTALNAKVANGAVTISVQ